jgi:peptidoglycan hydrolase CwlO-like protein
MKRTSALIAAVVITTLVGVGMLAIGVNAAVNTNTAPIKNAPGDPATNTDVASPDVQAQVAQLQNLVAQYQDREKQYQAQIAQYQSRDQQYQAQLNQSGAQLQQYQQLLIELQRRGLIRINGDGSILVPRRGAGGDDGG